MARDRLCVLQFIAVAVCLWTLQIQTQSVMADYVLEIKVTSYSNPTSRCATCGSNYPCCDGLSTSVCDGGDRCDNQFYYCLRPHNTSPTTRRCIGYEYTVRSGVNRNDASIDFSQLTVLGLPNPLNLTGLNTFWRGVQLYIEVLDYDRIGDDEFVDSFSININENTVKGSYLTLPDKSGTYNLSTIGLTARFLCAENYYGELCEKFGYCSAPQNSCNEHGVCSNFIVGSGYTCDCEPGYTGTYCKTDINECLLSKSRCSGHGRCIDGVNSFTCDCESGYTGTYCETDINECLLSESRCSGHGRCIDGANSFTCDCEPGYTGTYCKTDINECLLSESRCSGHGRCIDGVNFFTCDCDQGFTGLLCEANIDECAGVNCSGHGQCVDGVNNFTCVCQSGYTGDNCAVDVQGKVGGSSRGIIGGVVGGLVAVILTVLLLLLLVVLVMVAVRKRQVQVTQGIIQTPPPPPPYTAGDNPVYGAQDTVIIKHSDKSNTIEFDNPIYDIEEPEYETPITTRQPTTYETIPPLYSTVTDEHTEQSTHKDVSDTVSNTIEFDNPIYGDNDIEGPEYATPNTTRQTTTYEVPIPLYSTVTDDVWRRPQT